MLPSHHVQEDKSENKKQKKWENSCRSAVSDLETENSIKIRFWLLKKKLKTRLAGNRRLGWSGQVSKQQNSLLHWNL